MAPAGVARVCGHADAGRQELGARGRDDELAAASDAEGHVVEGAARRPILDLRLGDGGLEVDVPHGRSLDAVDVALLEEIAKAQLRQVPAASVDGRVFEAPVHREPDAPPQGLERLLVLARQLEAEVDEVRA